MNTQNPRKREPEVFVAERDLMRAMWRSLGERYRDGIVVLGAGRFTRRLFAAVEGVGGGPRVIAIADDHPTAAPIGGRTVVAPDAVTDPPAVLLGTDTAAEVLAVRAVDAFGDRVELIRPAAMMRHIERDGAYTVSGPPPITNPRRVGSIEALIVCVNYGDYLAWTLPRTLEQVERVVVVTASGDAETRDVAAECGAHAVVCDEYRAGGAAFNKGAMLNAGLAAMRLDGWSLVMDADIVLPADLGSTLRGKTLDGDALHYAMRVHAPEDAIERWLAEHLRCGAGAEALSMRDPASDRMPWGYFQLVHPSAAVLDGTRERWFGESFDHAGGVDDAFAARWPADRQVLLPVRVVHIPHGSRGGNWRGRVSDRLTPPPGAS